MNSRISLFFKGMLMGVAEIIPGVSGGTLAFITGIYNELINSIKSINFESVSYLVKLDLRKFWKHINGNFLFTLLLGMVSSIVLFSRIISYLLTNYNFHIWGFFFGLIISSAIIISRNINTFHAAIDPNLVKDKKNFLIKLRLNFPDLPFNEIQEKLDI